MTDRSLPSDPAPYYEAHVFVCTNDRGEGAKRPSCARAGVTNAPMAMATIVAPIERFIFMALSLSADR